MSEIDVEELARNLAKTAAGLDRHIAAKGKEIGDAFGRTYATAAREQIEDKDREIQRFHDLVAELRGLAFQHLAIDSVELIRIINAALNPATTHTEDTPCV